MEEIQRIDFASAESIDAYIKAGDLAKLSPQQRADLYSGICRSVGLNPLTRPFEFILLQGRLTLYAKKDCTDQLRRIYRINLQKPTITIKDNIIIAEIGASTPDGRTDYEIGAVVTPGSGLDHANALKKAITQAKRRVTLSICGLGFLDETEIEQIPNSQLYVEDVTDENSLLPNPDKAKKRKNTDIRKLGEFTQSLGNALFTEKEYNKIKLNIKNMAGLASKPVSQMSADDMEKYARSLVICWLTQDEKFDYDFAVNSVNRLAGDEGITGLEIDKIVDFCLSLKNEVN